MVRRLWWQRLEGRIRRYLNHVHSITPTEKLIQDLRVHHISVTGKTEPVVEGLYSRCVTGTKVTKSWTCLENKCTIGLLFFFFFLHLKIYFFCLTARLDLKLASLKPIKTIQMAWAENREGSSILPHSKQSILKEARTFFVLGVYEVLVTGRVAGSRLELSDSSTAWSFWWSQQQNKCCLMTEVHRKGQFRWR